LNPTLTRRQRIIDWAVATRALPGQTVSGDMHLVRIFNNGALAAVVDGLGHGNEATEAAKTAVAVMGENADQSVVTLVKRCHQALLHTRGAVMTLASYNTTDGTLTWICVGNVDGVLVRADRKAKPASEGALMRAGVVGYQLPPLHAAILPIAPDDLLILASDGIRSGFERGLSRSDSLQQMADRILSQHFKGSDDALVLTIRFLGPPHE